jgi:phosphoglucomutase
MDTHALSVPALASALEVLAASGFWRRLVMTLGQGYFVTHKPVKMNASNRTLADLRKVITKDDYH